MSVQINDKASYGTMSLTWKAEPQPVEDSIRAIEFAVSNYDIKFLNGGEFYGADNLNLKLLKEFLETTPTPAKDFIISIKGGIHSQDLKCVGTKESVTKSIKNVISFFPPVGDENRPKIIYQQARVDPDVPYDETIGYIQEFVKSGEIDGISISETGAKTIALAAETAPISAIEVEFSLFTQDIIHNGVLEEATKRSIPIIAYSPLARGLLTDHVVENSSTYVESLPKDDFRTHFDRFSPENFNNNLKLLEKLHDFAHKKKDVSLETLALSWIISFSESVNAKFELGKVGKIIPIPSGSTPEKIENNFGHLIDLTDEDLAEIAKICEENEVKGARYNAAMESTLFQ